jgi:probable F420-dependent oxidoreductase
MRLSVVTPVVTRVPGAHARWEEAAGMTELVEIARAADRLGYHHVTCSEHVGIPTDVAAVRGATYWDPLATFGYLAAVTERVRLATYVLVLGYHHPLEIAKRYGTLDLVSGGRLILGVGVGSLREEFDLLGAPFEDRGVRADDALVALRASLSREQPAYHGSHYDYDGFVVRPCAVQPRVPLWVGAAPGARSGGPWRWPTAGPRSGSRSRRWRTGWPASNCRTGSRW